MYELIGLSVVLIAWAAVSGRAAQFSITVPIALMLAGHLLAGGSAPLVSLDTSSTALQHPLQATLALILFADGTGITLGRLRRAGHLPLRLLLVAFPLTVLLGYAVGALLFPAASGWVIALVAAAVAATDASLAEAAVHDERIPHDVRLAVKVESGCNDGLAAPLVLFFLSGALAAGHDEGTAPLLSHTLRELAIALVVGVAVGVGAGHLLRWARKRAWSTVTAERLAYLAVGVLAFEAVHALHGNGIVAGFVAGLAVRAVDRDLPAVRLQTVHDVVTLLSAGVWFVFGSLVWRSLSALDWRVVGYALLSLTVVRMLPVAASLVGSHRPRREVLLLGWLGPCGLPSVIFTLLAVEQLRGPAATLTAVLITATVLLSVLAHGLSAAPIAQRWELGPVRSAGPPGPAARP
ncbi:cation:proton antiporter domain-containing protein [Catellatospora tritici]|uniref:cation:proton antiporter domain-containing protein n=1 Tax=Catellatospora tritici TaxID=2851566 RepID=UPI001C2D89AB|nr:cation:proton antiporter [Catellatospora tritici]MBV1850891.1 cation:proton antiporter [Catellatospora tritici]MBV1851144.1 cation:proton antiporter [Catellatospora tritici]